MIGLIEYSLKFINLQVANTDSVADPGRERGVPWNPPFTQMLAGKART